MYNGACSDVPMFSLTTSESRSHLAISNSFGFLFPGIGRVPGR
jgi:hypothetical protein